MAQDNQGFSTEKSYLRIFIYRKWESAFLIRSPEYQTDETRNM